MTFPRGYLVGTAIALALAWLPYGLRVDRDLVAPLAQTVIYVGLAVLTARSRRLKILAVRTLQRWVINPVVRALFAVGLNPLGLVILETRGRVSGRPRRTPVGNARLRSPGRREQPGSGRRPPGNRGGLIDAGAPTRYSPLTP